MQLTGSDASSRSWVSFGKFTCRSPAAARASRRRLKLADEIAEGMLGRLVRTQLIKGPREKGKLTYRIQIENGSPFRLNGVAAVGIESSRKTRSRACSRGSASRRVGA